MHSLVRGRVCIRNIKAALNSFSCCICTIDWHHSSPALVPDSRHKLWGSYVPTGSNDILSLYLNEPGEVLYIFNRKSCLWTDCKGISGVAEVQANIPSLWLGWKSSTKSELCIQEIILQTHSLIHVASLSSCLSLHLLNSGWQMWTFAEVLHIKLTTADIFPIIILTSK